MTAPQRAQVRFAALAKKRSNTGGNCFSMSVSSKNSWYSGCPQRSQYHWKPSSSPARRTRSITRPTVLAGRCGECGSFGGMSSTSPARIGTSTARPSCMVLSTISPSSW